MHACVSKWLILIDIDWLWICNLRARTITHICEHHSYSVWLLFGFISQSLWVQGLWILWPLASIWHNVVWKLNSCCTATARLHGCSAEGTSEADRDLQHQGSDKLAKIPPDPSGFLGPDVIATCVTWCHKLLLSIQHYESSWWSNSIPTVNLRHLSAFTCSTCIS